MPDGFQPIAFEGNPAGVGVWIAAANQTAVRLFFWNASAKALRSWPVASTTRFGVASEVSIATTHTAGIVWLGAQNRIWRISTCTGNVRCIAAPHLPVSEAAERIFPPAYRHFHNIVDLAVSPTGRVAVAETASSAVAVLSPNAKRLSPVSLPAGTAPQTVAYSADGTLAISLLTYRGLPTANSAIIVPKHGAARQVHLQSTFLTVAHDHFLTAGRKPLVVRALASDGQQSPVSVVAAPATGPDRALLGGSVVSVQDSAIAYGTVSGIAITTTNAADRAERGSYQPIAKTIELTFPTFACPDQSIASDDITTSQTCAAYPLTISADAAGNLWYQSSAPNATVSEITEATATSGDTQ